MTLPTNVSYGLWIQQFDETENHLWERDESADLYAFDRRNDSENADLGNVSLPDAHSVNVTVVNESGEPVQHAAVDVIHVNDTSKLRAVSPRNPTNGNGKMVAKAFEPFAINQSDKPGIELRGNVTFRVHPPNEPQFINRTYTRNLTVTNVTNITDTLEERTVITVIGSLQLKDGSRAT